MGDALSKAAQALRRKVGPAVMSQSALARELEVSQQAVSSWVKGRAVPEPERMARIEALLGIPMREWVEAAEPESSPSVDADAADDDDEAPAPAAALP